jgi:hydrogenase-4 transcriptional activator
MDRYHALLLEVWREASRQSEIGGLLQTVARMLQPHMPAKHWVVRRIDFARCFVETVAVGAVGTDPPLRESRSEFARTVEADVVQWAQAGAALRWRPSDPPSPLGPFVPDGMAEECLIGPLVSGGRLIGALVLSALPGRSFGSLHVELAGVLAEPFAVALENDHRQREMNALREAAEAEKRSLLTRLGRKSLGDTVVGADSGLHAVMDRVALVARSDVPVLVFGETGTGKELVARLIHNRSARSGGPFIRVNCGAIPAELIDSQLFGHERGAFTGAVETRQGWFERADGGTLLLDELGELPPAAQVRLLRILQDGWLERVGGARPIHVDVRMIAATHRDLAAMVSQRKFREDLWYRIAVFPIVLPPLRERRGDIASLASHFAEKAATRFGLAAVMPTAEDIALLQEYAWPGNVRELGAVIDRAAILGDGNRLEIAKALGVGAIPAARAADIPSGLSAEIPAEPPRPAVAAPAIGSLDDAIRRHMVAALEATQGRIEGRYGAARLLEINPHTLRARMRKLGIDWAAFRGRSE